SQSTRPDGGWSFAADRFGGGDDRARIAVLVAVRAGIVAGLGRRYAGMEIGARFDAVLKRIHAQLLLQFLPDAVGLAQVAAGCGLGFGVRAEEVSEHLKVGELVVRRKRWAGIALSLALNDFSQGLITHAALGVFACERLAREVFGIEHQTIADVGVVRNRDHVNPLFTLQFQVLP